MNRQLEALARVYSHLIDAHKDYLEFVKLRESGDPEGVGQSIHATTARVADIRRRVEDERDRRYAEIYGAGVLRVAVSGDGHTSKVTLVRPDGKSDKPYISEAAYNALRFKLGTASLAVEARFDVNVVAASGRIVATIPARK